jgi:hypothetical protein
MIGGLIPAVRVDRQRHAVETTIWIEITWLRTVFRWEATR